MFDRHESLPTWNRLGVNRRRAIQKQSGSSLFRSKGRTVTYLKPRMRTTMSGVSSGMYRIGDWMEEARITNDNPNGCWLG